MVMGSYIGIIFVDRVVLRKMERIANYRALIGFWKYLFLPFVCYEVSKDQLNKDVQVAFEKMIGKYGFGYQEYNR